jgi:hypothetical protein
VPGPGVTKLRLLQIPRNIAALAGLVARSHTMPIRDAVEMLPAEEQQECDGVHTPFLKVTLRIADYCRFRNSGHLFPEILATSSS